MSACEHLFLLYSLLAFYYNITLLYFSIFLSFYHSIIPWPQRAWAILRYVNVRYPARYVNLCSRATGLALCQVKLCTLQVSLTYTIRIGAHVDFLDKLTIELFLINLL